MKKSNFTEAQIVNALKEHENGRKVDDIARELGITPASFYKWKERYGGMEASDLKRLKDLQEENSRLKRMFADLSLDHTALKEIISKKGWARPTEGNSNGSNYKL
jgi:putative transposase